MSSRKARRRRERQRAKRGTATARRLSWASRSALIAAGAVLILGGVLLLVRGGPGTGERLGRLAGILILLGLVGMAVGVIGRA